MFGSKQKQANNAAQTATEKAAEAARLQAAALRERAESLRSHGDSLRERGDALLEKAAPLAGAATGAAAGYAASAKDWASPRLEKARDRGIEKAAPKVQDAAKALGPRVDEVHDKLVDDVLPKVVAAVAAAADAATERAHDAQKASHAGLDNVSSAVSSYNKPARRKRGGLLIALLGALAAAGAGFLAWKRLNSPTEDPWATAATPPRPASPAVKPADRPASTAPTSTGASSTGTAKPAVGSVDVTDKSVGTPLSPKPSGAAGSGAAGAAGAVGGSGAAASARDTDRDNAGDTDADNDADALAPSRHAEGRLTGKSDVEPLPPITNKDKSSAIDKPDDAPDTEVAKGHTDALPSDNIEPLPPIVEKGKSLDD